MGEKNGLPEIVGDAERLESIFSQLRHEPYGFTSRETDTYNCIAWANGDTTQWWWPTPRYGCYWPPGLPQDNKVETVIRLFEMHLYVKCDSGEFEAGYEKVAIYELTGAGVQHASRQLRSGDWTSKLGEWEDITHKKAHSVECDDYGKVVQFMKRRQKEWDGKQGESP